MKKISLIVAALAACSMGLVSCGGGDNPNPGPDPVVVDGVTSVEVTGAPAVLEVGKTAQLGANVVVTGNAAKTVTWSVDKTGLASIDANGLLTANGEGTIVVTARSTVDPTVKGTATISLFVDPQVKKVTISGAPAQMLVGEKATLSATVEVVGGASRAVRWSSDKPAVISVNSSGAIEANAAGTATITATAADDSTVFDSVTITVTEPNWSDELLAQMKEKLGEALPYLPEFENDLTWYEDDEVFYAELEETPSLEKDCSILTKAGYSVEQYSDGYEGLFEMIQVLAIKYLTGSRIVANIEQIIDYIGLFGGSSTALTAWNEEALSEWPTELVDEYSPKYMDFDKETVPEVDADEYYPSAGQDSLYIDLIGTKVTGQEYIESLAGLGWEIIDDAKVVEKYGGYVCYSPNETVSVLVTSLENNFSLSISPLIPELSEYPSGYVSEFVSEKLGSIFTVPDLVFQDEYYYMEGTDIDGSPFALVNIDYAEETTEAAVDKMVSDYKDALDALGYETELTARVPETETSYGEGPRLYAYKGKIDLQLSESQDYENEYDLYIRLNPYAEESAISVKDDLYFILATETPKIEVTVDPEFEGKGDLSFTSKNEAVATVDSEGNITAVAEGQAKIEVAYEVSADEIYKVEVEVNVCPPSTGIEVLADTEMNYNETQALSYALLPEGSKYETESKPVFAITEGSEYASITDGILTPNMDAIEEDVTVKVTATLDSFVSEPFEITIKYVVEGATIDFKTINTISGTVGAYSYKAEQKTGQNAPIWHDSGEIRLYPNNVLTVSSSVPMTTIEFVANTCSDSKNGGSLSCSTGEIVATDNGFLWTGNATEVEFTGVRVGSGDKGKQTHIQSMVINGGGEPGPGPTPVEKDALSLMKELCFNLFEDEEAYNGEDGDYYTGATWGTTSAYTLMSAVEEAIEYLPLDFIELEAPCEDVWEDGDDGVFAVYGTTDESVICEIGSYISGTNVVV